MRHKIRRKYFVTYTDHLENKSPSSNGRPLSILSLFDIYNLIIFILLKSVNLYSQSFYNISQQPTSITRRRSGNEIDPSVSPRNFVTKLNFGLTTSLLRRSTDRPPVSHIREVTYSDHTTFQSFFKQ